MTHIKTTKPHIPISIEHTPHHKEMIFVKLSKLYAVSVIA